MNIPKFQQSLANFKKAIDSLNEAVSKSQLSHLELAGAIQNFEFCYELSWKTLKKYGEPQGRRITSPRDAFQYAYESEFITEEKVWLDMIEDRNRTTHTYDLTTAKRVFHQVKENYFFAFEELFNKLNKFIK